MRSIFNRPPESGIPTTPLQLPGWLSGKEPACQCRRCKRCRFDPWVGKIFWSRKWQPTPVFTPGKSQGYRRLVGCSLWGHKSQTRLSDWVHSTPPYVSIREQILGGHLGTLVCYKTLPIYKFYTCAYRHEYERQEGTNKESLYTLNDITNNSETFLPFSDSIPLNLLKFCTYCLPDLI